MPNITIDGKSYDTDKLNATQKRLLGLYQLAIRDEADFMAKVEVARAARIEITRRVKAAFNESPDDTDQIAMPSNSSN